MTAEKPDAQAHSTSTQSEAPLYLLEGTVAAPSGPPVPSAEPMIDEPWPGLTGPRKFNYQRNLAMIANVRPFDGLGVGILAGAPRIGLELAAGYQPVLAVYTADSSAVSKYTFLNSWQCNATAQIGLYRMGPRTDWGLLVGYRYNTLLLHGTAAGAYFQFDITRHWALQLSLTFSIYPAAEQRIREKWSLPSTGTVGGGLLQAGPGVSLQFFP